jgi:RNA polymerase sigma-70 factor (ECF subfamily)
MAGDVTVPEQDSIDVRRSLDGDGDAYAALVQRHQVHVAGRMWRFARDRTLHDELVQEVFVQAYLSLGTYKGTAPFEHWLSRIATRVGYRFWKKQAAEVSVQSLPVEEIDQLAIQPAHEMSPSLAAEMLHRILQSLPPRDRLVLVLRHVEDRSVKEVADLTGWTQTMVKVQTWRARKKLKKLLETAGVEVD